MQIERCKGCKDLTAEEMLRFRSVEVAFQETSKSYGYSEVRTPTLEYLYLFTSAGTLTPGMLRRVYSFLDWDGWGGERVVLKPDATIPAARFYIDRLSQREQPARLSYVTNTFIFEETGTKARERWQCGAELIGAGSSMADVELVGMACDSVKKMGLNNIELKLSHAGLIRAILSSLGLSHSEQDEHFRPHTGRRTGSHQWGAGEKPQAVEAFKLMLAPKAARRVFLKNLRALFAASSRGAAVLGGIHRHHRADGGHGRGISDRFYLRQGFRILHRIYLPPVCGRCERRRRRPVRPSGGDDGWEGRPGWRFRPVYRPTGGI